MKSYIIDKIIRNSNWYKNQFEDAERILNAPKNLDIINFGSNPAKYSLDYSQCDMKGYNLAVGPETIQMDYIMLQNYHNYLRPDGPRLLLLLFCPFNICKDAYTEHDGEIYKNLRYYRILDKEKIPNFDADLYERMVAHPSNMGLRALYHALFTRYSIRERFEIAENLLTKEQMEQDANHRISRWKREFYLNDLNPNNLSDVVKKSLVFNSGMLDEIIAFCKERRINVIIVMPPLSEELNNLIPQTFREKCFYSIVREKKVPIYDYTEDKELGKNEFFLDSLFLNKKGRLNFTNKVIADIKTSL